MAAGHKYKGYTNDGRPLKITFDVDGDDTPRQGVLPFDEEVTPRRESPGSGLCFVSFGSGSSGNCAYLGTPRGGILIDAGIREPVKYHRKKKNADRQDTLTLDEAFAVLEHNGVTTDMIKGVLLTHAHQDHMRCLYAAASRCHCSVYCTMGVMEQLLQRCRITRRVRDHHVPIFKEIPFRVLDMEITPFETLHDVKSVGFSIEYQGERFVVGSDMGSITERAAYYMSRANYLMIECDYDLQKLEQGGYAEFLKDRVKKENGHLDNEMAAAFVANNYHEGLRNVFLCHLSEKNNTPELALATMRKALEQRGLSVGDASNAADQRTRDVQIYALPRYNSSAWFVLG